MKKAFCNQSVLCVDCQDPKCAFGGKAIFDCPKYDCDNDELYKCEQCDFMKEYQEKMRNAYKKAGAGDE